MRFQGLLPEPARDHRWRWKGSAEWWQNKEWAESEHHGSASQWWLWSYTFPAGRPSASDHPSLQSFLQWGTGYQWEHTWEEERNRQLLQIGVMAALNTLLMTTGKSYHMMMATRRMMASLRLSKKSLRSWPCSFMLPIIKPKHMEKTTSPRALTPFTWPGTGITSSLVISVTSWVPLVELKKVSFTVTVTWTTRFPYLVLNWERTWKDQPYTLVALKSESNILLNTCTDDSFDLRINGDCTLCWQRPPVSGFIGVKELWGRGQSKRKVRKSRQEWTKRKLWLWVQVGFRLKNAVNCQTLAGPRSNLSQLQAPKH